VSGICGWLGETDPAVLGAMLAVIDYRGEQTETLVEGGVALGYRWFPGRPGKSPGIFRAGMDRVACAGTLVPAVSSPAEELYRLLATGAMLDALDGAFAGAFWNAARQELTLIRDPFGIRSLYFVEHRGVLYFASELKQLLVVPDLPIELDPVAVHKYLAFSFVPGEELPIRGVRRLLPGHVATFRNGARSARRYFELEESIDPTLNDRRTAVREARRLFRSAVEQRLDAAARVGVFLSGGIDSSAVAAGLKAAGADVRAYSLDFGALSVEKPQAEAVAKSLGIPLELVQVDGSEVARVFDELIWRLDLPFGDPVTAPQFVLGRTAREQGLETVFNGEGGDQLFGGWTSKPMIAAELYAGLYEDDTREQTYLKSYHRFYGLEDELYTDDFKAGVGGPGQRRAHLEPLLRSPRVSSFLSRVRLADIGLKGSQNIVPRAERMANGWGLDVRMPLFDRRLAEFSFRLPPELKLRGATEKWVFKRAVRKLLPESIVWRRKSGMGVPITEWLLGPLEPLAEELLGQRALERRGLFRHDYVSRLRRGENEPGETRRRRIGERLWTLAMLEAWLRRFVDARGKRASAP
jgi:asparagine synthase (glutamine-hydrolysing)